MVEYHNIYAKWKKPNEKPIYYMIQFVLILWKEQSYRDMNCLSRCQGPGSRERGLTAKENEGMFWNNGHVVYLVCVGGYMTIHLSKWWVLLYVNHVSEKTEKEKPNLCFRVVIEIGRDYSPPPFFLLSDSSLFAAAVSLINSGTMINCNFLCQSWDATKNLSVFVLICSLGVIFLNQVINYRFIFLDIPISTEELVVCTLCKIYPMYLLRLESRFLSCGSGNAQYGLGGYIKQSWVWASVFPEEGFFHFSGNRCSISVMSKDQKHLEE